MIYALDSNIILYSEGVNDQARQEVAHHLIKAVGVNNFILAVQALGETVNALTRQKGLSRKSAAALIAPWFHGFKIQDTTREIFEAALELAGDHQFQVWDAVILAAASESGARVLFSEDMQDGFHWRDVTILNPFAKNPDLIVRELLNLN